MHRRNECLLAGNAKKENAVPQRKGCKSCLKVFL